MSKVVAIVINHPVTCPVEVRSVAVASHTLVAWNLYLHDAKLIDSIFHDSSGTVSGPRWTGHHLVRLETEVGSSSPTLADVFKLVFCTTLVLGVLSHCGRLQSSVLCSRFTLTDFFAFLENILAFTTACLDLCILAIGITWGVFPRYLLIFWTCISTWVLTSVSRTLLLIAVIPFAGNPFHNWRVVQKGLSHGGKSPEIPWRICLYTFAHSCYQ